MNYSHFASRVFHGFIDDPFISELGPHQSASTASCGGRTSLTLKVSVSRPGRRWMVFLGGLSADDREKLTSTNAAALWGL